MQKIVHFGEFLNTWSLRSNSVTRQVIFNKTKIDEKCQNFKMRHFWVIFKQYESSFWNTAVLTFGIFRIFLLGGIFFQSEMMIVTLLTMPDCKTAKSTVHAVMSEECLHRYFKMNRIVCVHGGWKSLKKSHFKKIPKFTFYPNSPFFA